MRRVGETVEVQLQGSRPNRIVRNGQAMKVQELLLCWVRQTGWWNPGGGERRVYYRLLVAGGAVVEVYRSTGGTWTLSRMSD